MKLSELIKQLQEIEGDPEVVLARDAEGNSYSRADFVGVSFMRGGNSYIDVDIYDELEPPEENSDWNSCVLIIPEGQTRKHSVGF
jgi:hypothetical protein